MYNERNYLRIYNGYTAVVTHWLQGRPVYWRCVWPITWGLYRQLQYTRSPNGDSRAYVDSQLRKIYWKKHPEYYNLERVRSNWDNYFGEIDGRRRRRSSADTVPAGQWGHDPEDAEWDFHAQQWDWIRSQPNPETLLNQRSNLQFVLSEFPKFHRKDPPPPKETVNVDPTPTEKKGRRSRNRRRNKQGRESAENQPPAQGRLDQLD